MTQRPPYCCMMSSAFKNAKIKIQMGLKEVNEKVHFGRVVWRALQEVVFDLPFLYVMK